MPMRRLSDPPAARRRVPVVSLVLFPALSRMVLTSPTLDVQPSVKMLYFSSDEAEVDLLSRELVAAGIPCEVRRGPDPEGGFPHEGYAELWIQHDRDCHRALMRCVELGAGFAKRPPRLPFLED